MAESEEDENELAELKALMERNAEAMAKLHAMVENLQRLLNDELPGDSPGPTQSGEVGPQAGKGGETEKSGPGAN